MHNTCVLIAAAGAGTRASLPYPKTLHAVGGRPILGRIFDVLREEDPCPTLIVSPSGRAAISAFLAAEGEEAYLVEQEKATGMGDAVIAFERSPAASEATTLVLMWGDIPFLTRETLLATLAHHARSGATLTFPSARVERAYTIVSRAPDGHVIALDETRVLGIAPAPGERDIGLFVFETAPVMDALRQSAAAHDPADGEHGFLHVIGRLAANGHRIEALPIATMRETISLNALSDLGADV